MTESDSREKARLEAVDVGRSGLKRKNSDDARFDRIDPALKVNRTLTQTGIIAS
jgi:hypothetical protein